MINIVLFEPEIPENVGNIARSCVAFNATLHLIRPYGFIFDINKFNRSSANHFKEVILLEYDSFEEFTIKNNSPNLFIYTRYGNNSPDNYEYKGLNCYIMFGKESTGIPKEIIKRYSESLIRIPTSEKMRSLNISNTVAIALYEISKQNKYFDLSLKEPNRVKE